MKLKPDQELDALNVLKGLPLFAGCSEIALKAIITKLDARDTPVGKVMLMDQEIAKTLFILSKGSVTVWKRIGGEKKQLATLSAPNFFGERSMFEESPASAMVKTGEKSMIYALERVAFLEVSAQEPEIVELIKKNMEEVRLKRLGPVSAPKDNPE